MVNGPSPQRFPLGRGNILGPGPGRKKGVKHGPNGNPYKTPVIWTEDIEVKILEELSRGYSMSHAAKMAGVSYSTVWKRRQSDPEFGQRCQEAYQLGTQLMEDEALRRAVYGVEKPVYQGGQFVGTRLEFSDYLLVFLLKARRPEVYRDSTNVERALRELATAAGINPDEAVEEAKKILSGKAQA